MEAKLIVSVFEHSQSATYSLVQTWQPHYLPEFVKRTLKGGRAAEMWVKSWAVSPVDGRSRPPQLIFYLAFQNGTGQKR